MQRRASVLAGALMVGLFAGPSARAAQASEADRLTYVTFSGPVEVPGVGLSAGTYIFKLADPETSRVIQVLFVFLASRPPVALGRRDDRHVPRWVRRSTSGHQ